VANRRLKGVVGGDPEGAEQLGWAKARVDWPVASATIADSKWELELL
jgi:hypothetical protein